MTGSHKEACELWCNSCCRWIPIDEQVGTIHTCYDYVEHALCYIVNSSTMTNQLATRIIVDDVLQRYQEKIQYRDFLGA
jgi:hypothetical protein